MTTIDQTPAKSEDDSQSSGSRTFVAPRIWEEFGRCVDFSAIYTTLPDDSGASERANELCEVCSKINLPEFFEQACLSCKPHYHMGKLEDIQSRKNCPLCRMISFTFSSAMDYLPDASKRNPLSCTLKCTKDSHGIEIHFKRSTPQWGSEPTKAIHIIRQCIEHSMISGDKSSNVGLEWGENGCLFGRLMEPRQVDFNLIRKWLRLCETTHGDTCSKSSLELNRPLKIRLINVFNRQIFEATTNERYVALSYVWGDGSLFCLNKQNLKNLQKPHGLTDDQIPKTIQDALSFVSQLGEQYLWVDRLCIIMDDEQDKTQHMSIMDQVYSSATLTIVSAGASCSDDCIPGVEPHTRRSFQQSEMIHGVRYITTQAELTSILPRMKWFTRGWTYQECFLSSRCLVFTPCQASFQCKSKAWCEDSYWVGTRQTEGKSPIGNTLCSLLGESGINIPSDLCTIGAELRPCPFHEYITTVEGYSRRHFTFEADVLWAFTGVIKAFQSRFPGGFSWGLPIAQLGTALLWQPDPRHGSYRVREGLHTSIIQSNIIKLPFPSWSWTSWIGGVHYLGGWRWIVEEFIEWHQPPSYIVNTTKIFDERWREASWNETPKAGHNYEHKLPLSPYAIMNERELGFLRFSTASVRLDVELAGPLKCGGCGKYYVQRVPCNIRTSTGKTIGYIWIESSWLGKLACKTSEFILLSGQIKKRIYERPQESESESESDSKSNDPGLSNISETKPTKDYESQWLYNIMLIDWKEGPHCAVATRIGLAQIDRNDWIELESSSKEIVLG